jgi:hypothetical protein
MFYCNFLQGNNTQNGILSSLKHIYTQEGSKEIYCTFFLNFYRFSMNFRNLYKFLEFKGNNKIKKTQRLDLLSAHDRHCWPGRKGIMAWPAQATAHA